MTIEKTYKTETVTKIEKLQLHRVQRDITISPSKKFCALYPIPGQGGMEVRIRGNKANWNGLQFCDSKTCVHCHGIRRRAFIAESERALDEVEKQGGSIAMLTLTCSNVGLGLGRQMEILNEVKRLLFKRASILRFMKKNGHIGNITSVEPQIDTERGRFHPHLHIALAFAERIDAEELEQWRSEAARMWCEYMQKRGVFAVVDQQHVTLAKNGAEAASYVAKGAVTEELPSAAHSVATEIGAGYLKQGRRAGSTTWFGLLRMIREADEAEDEARRAELVALYQRFEAGVHRKHLISISPALRELAETVEEAEDETVEEAEDETVEETVIQVPMVVYLTMVSLKIAHLAPVLMARDKQMLSAFSELCTDEQQAKELRGYENKESWDVRSRLSAIFDGLCELDVWAQNRALGIYQHNKRARDRLHIVDAV